MFKYKHQWTKSQEARSEVLFEAFPDIQKAYELVITFRNLYARKNIGLNLENIKFNLKKWYKEVEEAQITRIQNFKSTVEINEKCILSYFVFDGSTNAIAENRNGKIKNLSTLIKVQETEISSFLD